MPSPQRPAASRLPVSSLRLLARSVSASNRFHRHQLLAFHVRLFAANRRRHVASELLRVSSLTHQRVIERRKLVARSHAEVVVALARWGCGCVGLWLCFQSRVLSSLVMSRPVKSSRVLSRRVWSRPVLSSRVWSGPVLSSHVASSLVWFVPAPSSQKTLGLCGNAISGSISLVESGQPCGPQRCRDIRSPPVEP